MMLLRSVSRQCPVLAGGGLGVQVSEAAARSLLSPLSVLPFQRVLNQDSKGYRGVRLWSVEVAPQWA